MPVLSEFLAVKVDGMTDEIFDLQDVTGISGIDDRNVIEISKEDYAKNTKGDD